MTQDAPQIGVIIGGKFRVARILGKGGMGVVVAAHNLITGKQVAIKWMHAAAAAHHDAVQRLIQEAAASARVRHPNVVDVYDVIHDDSGVFLVMEYLNGEPLTRMLERGGMPVSELISVLIGAMRGVAAAHRAGVIHRDVKPDNIFLIRGTEGHQCIPKVLDFGISKITDHVGPSLTQTGTALGTPMYMSCEQLRNARDVDGRADVYAFGVILYEAVTGQSPFPGESFAEVVAKIMTTDPPTPKSLSENLPDELDRVIRHAMAKNRDERIRSLEDFIRALQPFATEPKFQLEIAEEDPTPPVDPSMVTALTPSARDVIGTAHTLNRPDPSGRTKMPTPSGAYKLRDRRDPSGLREPSGMVNLDVPPPAGVPPARRPDDDSIRPGHQTLDPRTTTHGERPRHVGAIGLLVTAAVLVGVVALLWPAEETAEAPNGLPANVSSTGQPVIAPGAADTATPPATPSQPAGDGVVGEGTQGSPLPVSVTGEVAATSATSDQDPTEAAAEPQAEDHDSGRSARASDRRRDNLQDLDGTSSEDEERAQGRRGRGRRRQPPYPRRRRDGLDSSGEEDSAYNSRMPPAPMPNSPDEDAEGNGIPTSDGDANETDAQGQGLSDGTDTDEAAQDNTPQSGLDDGASADRASDPEAVDQNGADSPNDEGNQESSGDEGTDDEEDEDSNTRYRAGELRPDEF